MIMKVVLENINKQFGKVVAVKEFSLEIPSGQFLVLLGPSGSGKTTVLRMIAGLQIQDSGNIYIGNTLVNDLEPKDRNLTMVFQNYALYPHMTVFNNIAFPLKVRKVPKDEVQRKVAQIASMLRIGELMDRKPREISGGEAQRVALGRTIIGDSQIFLMDEPLSNLDAKLRIQMRAELQLLHRKLKKTTIYVTHDQVEAMTIGEKITIMDKGILQQLGTPDEVYNYPVNRFVAEFIGSPPINMLEGEITRRDERVEIEIDDYFLTFPLKVENVLRESNLSRALVGVRPENVLIFAEKQANSLPSEVELVESIGSDLYVYLIHDDKTIIARTQPPVNLPIGKTVWLTFDCKKPLIFNIQTGRSLIAKP